MCVLCSEWYVCVGGGEIKILCNEVKYFGDIVLSYHVTYLIKQSICSPSNLMYISIHPSIHPFIYLSVHLPYIHSSFFFHLSIYSSIYLSIHPSSLPLSQTTEVNATPLEVTHWHFLGWPDHGCPQYATSLISFIRHVRKYYKRDSPPVLVHCSAGVGRTGTFILLDSMLERLTIEDTITVYELLKEMRKKRVFMVQTLVSEFKMGI